MAAARSRLMILSDGLSEAGTGHRDRSRALPCATIRAGASRARCASALSRMIGWAWCRPATGSSARVVAHSRRCGSRLIWPSIYKLPDGTFIGCRPDPPDDRAKLVDGFENLSPQSRYSRFLSATPRLTTAMLDRLFAIDGEGRVAIGAERMRFGIWPGTAWASPGSREPGSPEVRRSRSRCRRDAEPRRRHHLLHELAQEARAHGVARFTAWVQPDNTRTACGGSCRAGWGEGRLRRFDRARALRTRRKPVVPGIRVVKIGAGHLLAASLRHCQRSARGLLVVASAFRIPEGEHVETPDFDPGSCTYLGPRRGARIERGGVRDDGGRISRG